MEGAQQLLRIGLDVCSYGSHVASSSKEEGINTTRMALQELGHVVDL